jgi:hypothetical protein
MTEYEKERCREREELIRETIEMINSRIEAGQPHP